MGSKVPIYMSFRLYNITNKEDVYNGKKPILNELGPYTYLEKREKVSFNFSGNGEDLLYQERKSFYYDPTKSVGDPMKDKIITTLAGNLERHAWVEKFFGLIAIEDLFIEKTVHDMLWGYEDDLLTELCDLFSVMCESKTMGLLVGMNYTIGPITSIDTGIKELSTIGKIVKYNNMTKLNIWSSDAANSINGSGHLCIRIFNLILDGTMFKPMLSKHDTAYVFASDVCRSFVFEFKQTVTASNDNRVTLYQFVGSKKQAQNASINPDNAGFCPKESVTDKCPPGGLMDLSSCKGKGSLLVPLFASQPHFYLAEPWVTDPYEGIVPGSEADSTVLNIEPTLGIPLEAYKRLQFNFYLKSQDALKKYFKKMPHKEYFFPLFWLEEGATSDKQTLGQLYDKVLFIPKAVSTISFVGQIVGPIVLLVCVLSAVLVFIRIRRPIKAVEIQNESSQPMLSDVSLLLNTS
ncbi:scavenger receptor class B member [Cichlidogyrus casuarinus]|uniref:Scavenger receptor class B member n=1 Tax=Cichlidogyrus casuarinus TaxID=1844966 RepID=A0ABD2Q632_9PLAT